MTDTPSPFDLGSHFLRLRPDASVERLPEDEQFWPSLMSGQLGDWKNEYLVSRFEFTVDWPTWEVHPNGDEVENLLAGADRFLVETAMGEVSTITLDTPGEYVLVPKNCWHTAKVASRASMLFITPGEGTLNRPV